MPAAGSSATAAATLSAVLTGRLAVGVGARVEMASRPGKLPQFIAGFAALLSTTLVEAVEQQEAGWQWENQWLRDWVMAVESRLQ
ncbi:hypothetical protein E2562_013715 [Oryza meyeriana var. granulata]|uniref:Uncharacterized protein n=1 Tax=Oryza meyeriana var. granulata TaxID=110450 RepID=A0A6G1BJX5_9ORYZ|nr:hypothetical protein E2562_013715 [Oryza meyeriana var. granulata]